MVRTSVMELRHWLLADSKLAAIEILPGQRNWFARVTAKNILAVPAAASLGCVGILLLIAGSKLGIVLSLGFLLCASVLAVLGSRTRKRLMLEKTSGHLRELSHLKQHAILNGVLWAVMLGISLSLAGRNRSQELVLLASLAMFMSCIKYTSVPRVGVMHICCILAGSCIGLSNLGIASSASSMMMLTLAAVVLRRVIFHLFDGFALRELRAVQLAESTETAEVLLREFDEKGSDWMWEVDLDGNISRPSERFHAVTGRALGALARQPLVALFEAGQERDILAERIVNPAPFRRLVVPLSAKGETRWWSLSGRPNTNRYGEVIGLRGVATDVTQSKRNDAKIAHMAHYDTLTDLPNRVLFADTLKRTLERKRADQLVAVLYLDLDRFKSINDSMGHDVGDIVLKMAAQRIAGSIGAGDMVSRLGGDEFAVLVTSIGERGAVVEMALAILDVLAAPIILEGQQINVGTSIGIAFATDKDATGPDMLKNADLALYDAKSRGGQLALVFLPQMYEAMLTRRSIECDLGTAIAQNELELYYQPLVNIETNAIVAYEALLRWNHPSRGQIQPSVFIPIAEETGLIVQIGEWVIRNALMEVATWPDYLSVSVNLSPVQMRSPNIIPTIVNALAASGVAPSRLEIEITESVLMNDSETNLVLLHRLKALGLRISLDDFGTGYSSLNYLRSFPFDKIKIDRCFVEGITDRADCQAIIQAVLSLAASLNISTTAEGIENEEQLARLKADGCNQAQGYLFSRPLPAEHLMHKLQLVALQSKAA